VAVVRLAWSRAAVLNCLQVRSVSRR